MRRGSHSARVPPEQRPSGDLILKPWWTSCRFSIALASLAWACYISPCPILWDLSYVGSGLFEVSYEGGSA